MNTSRYSRILLGIIGTLFLMPFAVSAQASLDVVFTPDPLFSEDNMLPGDGAVGIVTVTNNSGEAQTIITEAINLLDPDSLSDQMELTITDDSSNTFFDTNDGSFQDFLTGGILTLTDPLGDGATVEYTFTVSFPEAVGDLFQETMFGFDLCVGFEDIEGGVNCGDSVISSEGSTDGGGPVEVSAATSGGGGGGGIVESTLLEISDEHVEELDVEVQTALIEWDTNLYSTSQVVYGLASGGTYSLSLLSPNFGYPSSTPETSNKVLHHAVLLEDLIPNEAYSYRVVSRSSPPTISFEHTFKFEEPLPPPSPVVEPVSGGGGSGSQTEEEIPVGFGGPSASIAVEDQSESVGAGSLEVLEDFNTNQNDSSGTTTPISRSTRGIEREGAEISYTDNQLAVSIFGLPSEFFVSESFMVCFVFFLLMLIIVYFGWLLWVFKNRRKYTAQFRAHYCRIYFPTTFFVTMVIAYTFDALCVAVGLFIMFIASLIWAFLDARDDE